MSSLPIPVFQNELMAMMQIDHANTIRQLIKKKKLPDFDVKITNKTKYWHRSTLVSAGLLPKEEASQQKLEASPDALL